MSFCPNCEAEYQPGVTVCADCNVALVDKLSPKTRTHDKERGEPVLLRSFKTSAEAELVSATLEQNGVRSFVEGGDFAIFPGTFSREVLVMVDERDLDRAIEIYEAFFNADSTAPAEE